jgi:hypothetical protein
MNKELDAFNERLKQRLSMMSRLCYEESKQIQASPERPVNGGLFVALADEITTTYEERLEFLRRLKEEN